MNTQRGPFFQSLRHAFDGVWDALQSERNMKIHAVAVAAVVILGILLQISAGEWIACVSLFGLVIGAEMINTALEITVDVSMPQRDPRAKRIKDTAAGAVLIVALAAAIVGLIIFAPKLIALFV